MAETVVPAGDATAVVVYSTKTFAQAIRTATAAKMMAVGLNPNDPANIVQYFDETQKGAGDTVKYDLIYNPTGFGVAGDGVIAGQETPFTWDQDTLKLDQLRQSILLKGRMSQQRVPYSMREKAKVGLANWFRDFLDYGFLNQAAGNTFAATIPGASNNGSGMNAPVAPAGDHWICAGVAGNGSATNENTVAGGGAQYQFTNDIVPQLVAMAQGTLSNPIKPVMLKGIEISGVLFLHPLGVKQLKQNYSSGEWGDIFRAALQGGQVTGNPIFTGAIGMIDNVVIHQDAHVPYGDGVATNTWKIQPGGIAAPAPNAMYATGYANGSANLARAVFVGAQSVALAVGGSEGPVGTPLSLSWVEELLDAANQLRITGGLIWGSKKTVFGTSDYSTIVVSHYAA